MNCFCNEYFNEESFYINMVQIDQKSFKIQILGLKMMKYLTYKPLARLGQVLKIDKNSLGVWVEKQFARQYPLGLPLPQRRVGPMRL